MHMEKLRDAVFFQLGADNADLAGIAGRALSDFVFPRNIVEVEPCAIRGLNDAFGSQDRAAHAEIQFLERFFQLCSGIFPWCFHAPCGENLIRVVIVMMVVVFMIMVVMMPVAVIFMVMMVMMLMVVIFMIMVMVAVIMIVFFMVIVVMMLMVMFFMIVMVMMLMNRFLCQLFEQLLLQGFIAFHRFEDRVTGQFIPWCCDDP